MSTPLAIVAALLLAATPGRVLVPARTLTPTFPPSPTRTSVEVAAFELDLTPVSNAQFLRFVTRAPKWRRGAVAPLFADDRYLSAWAGPLTLGAGAPPAAPVVHVSWYAADAYCRAAGGRLPSWYEWELVAIASERAPDARRDEEWLQKILAWYATRGPAVEPVGGGAANYYGVYDVHDRVWEWVDDFDSLLVAEDSREQKGADQRFCGSGALSAQDKSNYAMFMRIAMLSALEARFTTSSLGFRCAYDATRGGR